MLGRQTDLQLVLRQVAEIAFKLMSSRTNVMKKQRFMLRYTGGGPMPPGDLAHFYKRVSVLDQCHKSLLVEDVPEHLSRLLQTIPRWRVWSEWSYNLLHRVGGFPTETNYVRLGLFLLATGLFPYLPISCQG